MRLICFPRLFCGLVSLFLFAGTLSAATWTTQTPSTLTAGLSIRSFWGTGSNLAFVVGGNNSTTGRLYRWNGSAWSEPAPSEFAFGIRAVFGFSSTEIWVGGRDGNVKRSLDGGNSWAAVTAGLPATFNTRGMWGAANNDIWLVGLDNLTSLPLVYRWNGSTWSSVSTALFGTNSVQAVWGTAANNVVMVADGGLIARWNGSTLALDVSGTTQPLLAVWGLDANNIWATGNNSTILKWNGSTWSPFSTSGIVSGTLSFSGISGSSASNLYVSTGTGSSNVFHWDGSSWAQETTTIANSMNAIWCSSTGSQIFTGGAASLMGGTASVATAPEIAVSETTFGNITDGTSSVSFGTTPVGTPVTKTFTVTNSGTAVLNLSGLTVPLGFTIAQNFASSTVAASGGTTTFQITMSAGAAATPSGTLTFTNDDANENPFDFTISGTVMAPDTTPPVISGTPANIPGVEATGPAGAVVAFASPTANDVVDGPRPVTCIPPSGSVFPLGTSTVVCTAMDLSNNSASTSFTVTVVDTTPPVIMNTPANITGIVATSPAGAVVTYTNPTASDIVDGPVPVFCVLPSGSTFAIGTTTVVCTASDVHGNSASTSFTVNVVAAPEIAVSYSGNDIADGSTTLNTTLGTDFGSTPVQGGVVEHTFTITNSGTANLTLSGGPNFVSVDNAAFSVTLQPSGTIAPAGTTTFKIAFNPSALGSAPAVASFGNNDSNENPFNFAIIGIGTGPQTFDLAGNPVSNTPFEGGETYIYSLVPPTGPVVSGPGDATTNSGAPDSTGAADGNFNLMGRGGYLSANGVLGFPGTLKIAGAVTALNNQGYWKDAGTGLKRLVRSSDVMLGTGGASLDALPTIPVPGINSIGQVTLLGTLRIGTGTVAVTANDDTAMWSEAGGSGLQLLARENDPVTGVSGAFIASFGFGCYATATTGVGTGEAAFTIKMKGATTQTALIRRSITGAGVGTNAIIAREASAAPGVAGQNFAALNGSLTSAVRMDPTGNLVFEAQMKPNNKLGIWYQPVGGSVAKVLVANDTTPGTSGATFASFDLPSMGSGGTVAFSATLNANGDNATNAKNSGIWRGVGTGAYTCILRRGDPALPGMVVGSKVGNLWNGWLNLANHGAWKGWVDTAGDGISPFPADTFGIYSDIGGTMRLLISSGDAAPGVVGSTMFAIDHPVVSGNTVGSEYVAFLGTVTGGGVTAGVNDKAVWRSTNGAAPTLVLRTGDSMTTSQGSKTVFDIDIPGSGQDVRPWEQSVMDDTGRILLIVTFTDGSTAQVIAQ